MRSVERSPLCRVIVEARHRAGLSQRAVARELGRAHSFVAKIETGDRRLEVSEFVSLAYVLCADPKALLDAR